MRIGLGLHITRAVSVTAAWTPTGNFFHWGSASDYPVWGSASDYPTWG